MFDTPITIVGNVLTAPESRRTSVTGTFVVTFRLASTSRRFDRTKGEWVDGDSLRVRVACWRRLGENVQLSVQLGDPLIVHGRLYARDWEDRDGNKRTSYELDAIAVGHDLARGVDKFARRKAAARADMIDDEAAEASIGGEFSEIIDDAQRPEDLPPESELFEDFDPSLVETSPLADTELAEEELVSISG